MDRLGTMKRAVFLAALILCFPPSRGQAQSIGGACSTAGSLSLIGSSSPGELLYCNGSTWGLAAAITSGGLIGIGTTSPIHTFTVASANSNARGVLVDTDVSGTAVMYIGSESGQNGYLDFQKGGSDILIIDPGQYSSYDPKIYTGSTKNLDLQPGTNMSVFMVGNVAIGASVSAQTTGTVLDLGSNTNSMLLPVGTTGQRPTGANGMLRYNSTVPQVEAYVNGAWAALSGGGGSSTITLGTSAAATNPQRSGDAATGLFSPAANTVAAATGGTERVRIDSSGNVGIGTASPGAMLYVNGSSTSATPFIVNTPSGFIGNLFSFQVNGTPVYQGGVGNGSGSDWLTVGSGIGASTLNIVSADGYSTNLGFDSGPGNAGEWSFTSGPSPYNLILTNYAGANVMSWAESTGNVGIGTTAPAAPLHVAGEAIVGNTGLGCSSTTKGGIRWNNTDLTIEMCDGTNWNRIAAAPPAGCTGPSAFSFTNLTNQSLSTVVTSNTITPSGCATALSVSVSGGGSPQISINGGAWVSSAGMNPGDTIAVRLTSSGSVNTTRSAVVQIGTTSSTWTVTTLGGQTQFFQTANSYNGNLGGLSGADAICMSEANAFGYPGTWKAVLSTSTVNARDRLTILYPVVLASGGGTIASSNLWNTLTGPIGGSGTVWTGSNGDGTSETYYAYFCSDWTSTSSYGSEGYDVSGYEVYWLHYYYNACTAANPIYCVNQ